MSTAINALGASDAAAVRGYTIAANAALGETLLLPDTTDATAKYGVAVDWVIETGYADFSGQTYADPVMCVGYNVAVGGRKDSGEISVGMFFEADYYLVDAAVPSGRHSEAYIATRGGSTDSHNRPLFFQWDRVLGTLIVSQVHAAGANGSSGFRVLKPTGGAGEAGSPLWTFSRNSLTGVCDDTTANLILNLPGGSTNRAGQVTLGYGATANVSTFRPISATTIQHDIGGAASAYWYSNPSGGNGASALGLGYSTGSGDSLSNSQILGVDLANASNGVHGIRARGKSAGTGDILQMLDSSNGVRFSVTRLGSVVCQGVGGTPGTNAALVRGATDGFFYVPEIDDSAGNPNGTPTAKTGGIPFAFGATAKKLYAYTGGAWVATAALA